MKKIKITEGQLQKLTEAGPGGMGGAQPKAAEPDVMGYLQSLQKQINELKSQLSGAMIDVVIPQGGLSLTQADIVLANSAGPVTGTIVNQKDIKASGNIR